MADEFDKFSKKNGKRRRCYYDFSKNYPGTRYDKNKRSSTSDALDNRKKIRVFFAVALVVVLFFVAYFVVFTAMEVSHTPVEGLENVGVTQPASELPTIDVSSLEELKNNIQVTDESTTVGETTTQAEEDTTVEETEQLTEAIIY